MKPPQPSRHQNRRLQRLAPMLAMAAAWAWFDAPLLLRPFASPHGFPSGDYAQSLWNFWWLGQALAELRSPFLTDRLFLGAETGLFFHTLNIFYFLLTLPLRLFSSDSIFLYNLSVLALDALALAAFYRLARFLRAPRPWAALLAVCYAFCAYRLQQTGTPNILSIWLIPAGLLALARCLRKNRSREGLWLGLCLLIFLTASWHYLLFSLIALPFCLAWLWTRRPGPAAARALGLAALIVLPLLGAYLNLATRQSGSVALETQNPIVRIRWSASPLYYLTPARLEGFWEARRALPADFVRLSQTPPAELIEIFCYKTGGTYTLFLGLVPLLLALLAMPRLLRRRQLPLWLGLLLFFLLSLGPFLILVNPVQPAPDRFFALPLAWLYDFPPFSAVKHLSRYGIFVLFFLLLLLATARPPATRRLWPLALALLLLHAWDMAPFRPRPQPWQPEPALRQALASLPADELVLYHPGESWLLQGRAMYLQTLHQRPLVAGYVSRAPRHQPRTDAIARWRRSLTHMQQGQPLPPDALADAPASILLDHQALDPGELERITRALALQNPPYHSLGGGKALSAWSRATGISP